MDNFQLPTPQQGGPTAQNNAGFDTAHGNMQPVSPSGSPQQDAHSSMMPASQNPPNGQVNVVSGIPLTADDIDLIEKQWVSKAKEIVEKTSNDPYLQTKEINKFKAEYIKKRYNKDVKVMD